jgi:hypothetical protein
MICRRNYDDVAAGRRVPQRVRDQILKNLRHPQLVTNRRGELLPHGSIGILPNPYNPAVPVPPDSDFRVVYQDHDGGRTEDVTGWPSGDVLALIKDRAAADGLPFPEPAEG